MIFQRVILNVLFSNGGYKGPYKSIEFSEIIETISGDRLEAKTVKIRSLSSCEKDHKDTLKAALPKIVPAIASGERDLSGDTIASGLIQWDIDDDGLDYDALKTDFARLPYIYCVMFSPSRKLTVFAQTDFAINPGDDAKTTKDRFRIAHGLMTKDARRHLSFEFDGHSNVIGQLCSLCADGDPYYNPNCETLRVNDLCVVAPSEAVAPWAGEIDEQEILDMLAVVPRKLPRNEYLAVNSAVLFALGPNGVPYLEGHWDKNDKKKVKQDLQYQLKNNEATSFGALFKYAIPKLSKPLNNKAKRNQKAQPSDFVFPALNKVQEAEAALDKHIEECLAGASKVIRVSCGFGKTEVMLRKLLNYALVKKVLFLTQSHEFARELNRRFNAMKRETRSTAPYTTLIRGKEYLCDNKSLRKKYDNSPPFSACMNECMYQGVCRYVDQFNEFSNLRFAWVGEYYHDQSAFWNGTDKDRYGNVFRRDEGFEPDLIVMDESFIDFETDKALFEKSWGSLTTVIAKVNSGMSISEAVRVASGFIFNDVAARKKAREGGNYSEQAGDSILDEFLGFLNGKIAAGRLDRTISLAQNALYLNKRKMMAKRHANTPTIILDATIKRTVAEAAFPGFEFVDISVKQHDEFRVFQAQNVNFSKEFLSKGKNLSKAIDNAKAIAKTYLQAGNAVHVIAQKSVADSKSFYQYVADQIGATECGYFGNIRGTDRFKTADCLFIFGWHRIPNDELVRKATALFGPIDDASMETVNVPIRMKDGKSMSLTTNRFKNPLLQATYEHWCQSEVVQAVGRGRPIRGKRMDVYVFSDESLGSDVEVFEFFDFDHSDPMANDRIGNEIDFIEDVKREFLALGFTEHEYKKKKAQILHELTALGFRRVRVEYYYTRRYERRTRTYFSRNDEALILTLGGRDHIITAIDEDGNPVT